MILLWTLNDARRLSPAILEVVLLLTAYFTQTRSLSARKVSVPI